MNKSLLQSPIKPQHRKIISQQQSNRPFRLFDKMSLFTKHRIPLVEEIPQLSERQSRRFKKYFSTTIRNSSCNCINCGKNNLFIKKTFQLFPFESNFNRRKRLYKKFRKYIHCVLFMIRYKIVQKIRDRQRNKMKKAINQNVHIHKPSAVANLLAEGIKQLKQQQQHHIEVLHEHDSDEEFYQFKPKMHQNRKSFAHFLSSPKGQKKLERVYYVKQVNRPISQYIANRPKPNTTQCSPKSILPQLSSLYDFKNSISVRQLKKF
ncbi:unnamed protein product [Paramecium primaurelia]|uniref:Uncharacterized protein n=1 Tax=Paramecium primaurelia TaxID=5886 RepID=A0A8S1JMX6_PARPR|nr:unnamed protein product [Paramecium primaurelia]